MQFNLCDYSFYSFQWKPRAGHSWDFVVIYGLLLVLLLVNALIVYYFFHILGDPDETLLNPKCVKVFVLYACCTICDVCVLVGHLLTIRSANVMRIVREPIKETIMAQFLASITQEFNTEPKIKYLSI